MVRIKSLAAAGTFIGDLVEVRDRFRGNALIGRQRFQAIRAQRSSRQLRQRGELSDTFSNASRSQRVRVKPHDLLPFALTERSPAFRAVNRARSSRTRFDMYRAMRMKLLIKD
jgi:hypothetical protein